MRLLYKFESCLTGHSSVTGSWSSVHANFKEIVAENDLANFLSVQITKPSSVNMAEPQKNQAAFATGDPKIKLSHIYIGGMMQNLL